MVCIHCLTAFGLFFTHSALGPGSLFIKVITVSETDSVHNLPRTCFSRFSRLVLSCYSGAKLSVTIWNGLLNNSLPYYTNYWYHIVASWTEELAQQLRTSTTPIEHRSSIPAPIRGLTMTCNSSSRSSDPLASGGTCIHGHTTIDRHAHTQVYRI